MRCPRDRALRQAEKKLNANVDFYSASTYTTLGIDIDLFTPIFAISPHLRLGAHVIEQHDDNRLIRPRADYTGPAWPAPYIPREVRMAMPRQGDSGPE
jgi:citrate synthase